MTRLCAERLAPSRIIYRISPIGANDSGCRYIQLLSGDEHGRPRCVILNAAALASVWRDGDSRLREKGMTTSGLDVIPGNDMTRIRAVCEHQSGLIYVVPADRSWVCDQVNLPAHALAGFFRELTSLENKEVQGLMQEWGIYYRQLPKDQEDGVSQSSQV